jgi:hypothetical protein
MLVLVLPINLLWKVKITLRQKLTLGALLCLTVCTVAVSIARIIVVLEVIVLPDLTWLNTLSVVEQGVGTSSRVSFLGPSFPTESPFHQFIACVPTPSGVPPFLGGCPTSPHSLTFFFPSRFLFRSRSLPPLSVYIPLFPLHTHHTLYPAHHHPL